MLNLFTITAFTQHGWENRDKICSEKKSNWKEWRDITKKKKEGTYTNLKRLIIVWHLDRYLLIYKHSVMMHTLLSTVAEFILKWRVCHIFIYIHHWLSEKGMQRFCQTTLGNNNLHFFSFSFCTSVWALLVGEKRFVNQLY